MSSDVFPDKHLLMIAPRNLSKQFNINLTRLVVNVKLVERRFLDLFDSEPELLHVDFGYISSNEKGVVAGSVPDDIQDDLIGSFSKVVPYVATELVQSDDMGKLVAKLISYAIVYGRCQVFEEVANMKEPFNITK
ncbi:hypothetical protein Tco_1452063, partial [Tanacetum coccineum]